MKASLNAKPKITAQKNGTQKYRLGAPQKDENGRGYLYLTTQVFVYKLMGAQNVANLWPQSKRCWTVPNSSNTCIDICVFVCECVYVGNPKSALSGIIKFNRLIESDTFTLLELYAKYNSALED